MELTASHAIQGVLLLATVAGGYAVVKSNLARVMEDLEVFHKNFDKFKAISMRGLMMPNHNVQFSAVKSMS